MSIVDGREVGFLVELLTLAQMPIGPTRDLATAELFAEIETHEWQNIAGCLVGLLVATAQELHKFLPPFSLEGMVRQLGIENALDPNFLDKYADRQPGDEDS